MSDAVLIYPDLTKQFTLATDASQTAIGAVLSQEVDGHERPIAYASRKLNPAETRYSTTEKELLAVVWAIRHFQAYLLGRQFVLETDHMALTAALRLRDPTSRVGRWVLRLSEYDFTPKYRPGSQMGHADGLSRMHMAAVTVDIPRGLLKAAQDLDEWVKASFTVEDRA